MGGPWLLHRATAILSLTMAAAPAALARPRLDRAEHRGPELGKEPEAQDMAGLAGYSFRLLCCDGPFSLGDGLGFRRAVALRWRPGNCRSGGHPNFACQHSQRGADRLSGRCKHGRWRFRRGVSLSRHFFPPGACYHESFGKNMLKLCVFITATSTDYCKD